MKVISKTEVRTMIRRYDLSEAEAECLVTLVDETNGVRGAKNKSLDAKLVMATIAQIENEKVAISALMLEMGRRVQREANLGGTVLILRAIAQLLKIDIGYLSAWYRHAKDSERFKEHFIKVF